MVHNVSVLYIALEIMGRPGRLRNQSCIIERRF